MSNMKRVPRHRKTTTPKKPAPLLTGDSQLELFAIEEQFVTEWRAHGNPRLSTYMRQDPDYAGDLATFLVHTFTRDGQVLAPLLEDAGDGVITSEHPTELSTGMQLALGALFDVLSSTAPSQQLLVAETGQSYNTRQPASDETSAATQDAQHQSSDGGGLER